MGETNILIKPHSKSVHFSYPLLRYSFKETNTELGERCFFSICTEQPNSHHKSSTIHLGEYGID